MYIDVVQPDSIAEDAGIEPGDKLLSINGQKIKDIFDYRFLTTEEKLVLCIEKRDGEIWEVEIEKEQYEDLGIEFENPMIDDATSCTNKCIFCFIDQLPKGMRKTLYFKDDDARLSFLTGNYVTLTNIDNSQIDRIIRYKMSPVNVSVHTTNPGLRVFMLNNRFAGDVLDKIKKLTDGGIIVNCQIVLCKGINDGDELDRTIADLGSLYPGVRSVSVVPVGITKYRDGLYKLEPFDKESSNIVINQIADWQKDFLKKYGTRLVYAADEFYIMAGLELPKYEEYEDFPQLENGVGLIALFRQEFYEHLENLNVKVPENYRRNVSIATGVLGYRYIKKMAEDLEKRIENLKINVYEIKNSFFGENVTVTGLLTGADIVSQLSGKELGDVLLISRSTLKAGEDLLLDDYTVG
ncbi:MAG TPA: DUF512 domain-containing protein, partial [Clostridiaceae bacterium]|nr:DUF512 domain-containing protein [Clostridiaceae bacterium]